MEVILLEKIRNLGDIGNKVNVKAGFARNYLLPQKKAVQATLENSSKFKEMRAELEKKAAESLAAAESRAEVLAKLELTISMRAGEGGKLFGSVGPREIVATIVAAGEEVDKREVIMPEGPIHQIGEYEVTLQLHTDLATPVKIVIIEEK